MCETYLLYDTIAVPVLGLSRTHEPVFMNKEARKVFAAFYGAEQAHEESIKALTVDKKFANALNKARKSGSEYVKVTLGKQKKGAEYLALIRAAQIGECVLIVTLEDRSYAKDAKTMRSDFVANVSHEIRSPLTAISGFVETLRGAAHNDPATSDLFLELMQKEINRMTSLVRDLLSLSQVEAKERRALENEADIIHIIEQSFEAGQNFASVHSKTLELVQVPKLSRVLGKHDDLVRVLINLLENAVMYSRANSVITLHASVVADNPLGKKGIAIRITDQGEGIPKAEIPRLTERFYRVDKSRSRNAGGTGLGLAIVKHILRRHRGVLDIQSTLGEGSTFTVFLPLLEK